MILHPLATDADDRDGANGVVIDGVDRVADTQVSDAPFAARRTRRIARRVHGERTVDVRAASVRAKAIAVARRAEGGAHRATVLRRARGRAAGHK
jgi:hypothetical protein